LANLGYGFETKKCAICQGNLSSQKNFFSAKTGGTLCLLCAKKEIQKININNEAIKLIRIILENKIENLVKIRAEKESVDGLKRVASEAVRWIL
jgi:recombinational DNA repair protein (RecF pathway)